MWSNEACVSHGLWLFSTCTPISFCVYFIAHTAVLLVRQNLLCLIVIFYFFLVSDSDKNLVVFAYLPEGM